MLTQNLRLALYLRRKTFVGIVSGCVYDTRESELLLSFSAEAKNATEKILHFN